MATAAAAASITPLLYTKYSCVVLTAARVYPERQKKFLAGQSTTIKANFGGDHFYNHRFHAIMEGYRRMTDTEKELIISKLCPALPIITGFGILTFKVK